MRSGLLKILFCFLLIPAGLIGRDLPVEPIGSFPNMTPTITGPTTVCANGSSYIYFTEPGKSNYFWTVSGGNITTLQNNDSITVTWNAAGPQTVSVIYEPETTTGVLNVTVLPPVVVGITISASANPVCAGTLVTYTATPSNEGSSPFYRWKINGIDAGTNSLVFSYYPNNLDIITCELTSNLFCTTVNPVTSASILMIVNPNLPVSISIAASSNPSCGGNLVTYTATPVNGGSTPVYQWKVNGFDVGSNNSTYSFFPGSGNVITCVLTSNANCATGSPATSNAITMTVSPALPVGVSIAASANPACVGNLVTFTATQTNGGLSPFYQWKVDGSSVGINSSTYSYIPANGEVVSCVMTSNAGCTTGNPATSNQIIMSVIPNSPVSVSVSASANPVCDGIFVTFTATAINGGSAPVYHWFVNGYPVGTNSSTYSYLPANFAIVTCELTSNLQCASGNPATSIPVIMTVTPSLPASVSIIASANPACQGTPVQFTATVNNGGAPPVYQWKVNDLLVGPNDPLYTYIPGNGDIVTCQITSTDPCNAGSIVTSNAITMMMSPGLPVSISITVSVNPVCQGNTVTFTAIPVNGGSAPVYDWMVGGVPAGIHTVSYSYIPTNGEVITCKLTSSLGCATVNPAISNAITMTVSSILPVSVSISASSNPSCMGQAVTFTATPVNGGASPLYLWMLNGLSVGTNSPTYSYIPTGGDFIKCMLTSGFSCATGNPAFSNQISMIVNPNLPVSVSITASANPSCAGASVTYTATAINGGSAPGYQWKVNGVNAGTGQNTFSYLPVNGDIVTCLLTSNAPCPISNPVTSNAITMIVNPILPVSISISTMTNPSCTGSQVTFSATTSNGGTIPHFQWKKNGANAGSDSPFFVYIPINGDVITCQLTSNALCYTGNLVVQSNAIAMIVLSSIIPGVTIAASANPYCQGTPVTFTATPINGGTAPSYQWKVNCVNVGTNNPVYTYTPADGDFITCRMTSNLVCAIQNPTTSNAITMKKGTSTPVSVSVIASSNPFCQGTSVNFTATPVNGGTNPAYQWKKNGANAGTNSPIYSYNPFNNDVVTCTLTSNATCASGSPAISNPVTMVSSLALPVNISISTLTNPFCQGSLVTFTSSVQNGGPVPVFQWKLNGVAIGGSSPTYSYIPTNGDVITCQLTSNSTCISGGNPVTSNAIIMVSSTSLPAGISISSSATTVCQGSTVTFTATGVNGGNNPVYQWKVNGGNAGSNQPVYSYIPANGDVITCQLTSDLGCATGNPAQSNSIAMTVNPALPVSVTITVSCNPCCQGTPVTFTAAATNGGSAPVYQWRVNCVTVGTNSPTYNYTPVNGDVVVCQVTSNEACTSGSPAISNNINMVVMPVLLVTVSITASANPFCIGEPVTFTAVASNGGSAPSYQWIVNNANVGPNNSVFTYTPTAGDIVKCQVTSNVTCAGGNPAMSNQMTMFAEATLPVTISISTNYTTVCHGAFVTFTATSNNGGTSPVYQWKVNNNNRGTNNTSYTYSPDNGDVVTCQLATSLSCASPNPAVSNSITMTVNPQLPVSVSIVASANPICEGTSVCYTATVINGGTIPFYSWRVNGNIVGPNSPTFCYTPLNGDVIYCRVVSNAVCPVGNPSNSNSITMTVNPYVSVGVTISASANPVCQGASVTFTATPVNGGSSPVYHWKVNGSAAGTNSSTFSYLPVNGDVFSCEVISNASCVVSNTALSNLITITVSPTVPVSVAITSSANPVCQGTSVTFNAIPVNGGTSPSYQWKVNGTNSGGNTPVFTYIPLDGDIITCVLLSSALCAQGSPATSDPIIMSVTINLPVSVTITASSTPQCQGPVICYTATPVNGGANPAYQWRINSINVGTNSPTYCYPTSSGDVVSCQLTSSNTCASMNPAFSNEISMTFSPSLPVSISISCSANPSCQGTPVTFTAVAANGGSAPEYQWKVNGNVVGSNITNYSYIPSSGDVITCRLTSNVPCPINNPATSNPITMTVLVPVSAAVSITGSANPVCSGTPVTFTAAAINGGSAPVYHWHKNGSDAGTNSSTFTYMPVDGDYITCQLTSNLTCVNNNPVTSNMITMVVSSDFPLSVSVAASDNPTCQGQVVTYIATQENGGTNPAYQWMVNGIDVGTNSLMYSYSPSDGDLVKCIVTSSYSCASNNPATSNQILMTVIPIMPVSVSITGSFNPACTGTVVTYTAIAINGGSAPSYQWKVNGVDMGSDSPTFPYIPVNGDIITCQVTSNRDCITGNPAVSNQIIMIVGSGFPVSVSIAASSNPICVETQVTYTATPTYGGSIPSYQWKVNGITKGSDSTKYTCYPAQGDQTTCTLTSNLTCGTGNPAISNVITMTVLPVPVGITIEASPTGPVCAGDFVTFTATPQNGGANPTYKWKVNTIIAGINNPVFCYQPADGDIVTCQVTSNATCASGNTVTSDPILMTVNPLIPVSVTITADPPGFVCSGTLVTFTATAIHGGPAPIYQWKVNGDNAGSNNSTFTYFPVDGDIITCTMTSNLTCPSGNPATSNAIIMDVLLIPIGVSITASTTDAVCAGTYVTFTAFPLNGGSSPTYYWKVNGADEGPDNPVFSYPPADGDIVTCVLASNATCAAGNVATSNSITMAVNPILPVSINITASANPVCVGVPVTFTGVAINGGSPPAYQWKVNGADVGINSPAYSYTPLNGDVITCILNSNVTCASGSPAISNAITIAINPNLPVSVSIAASQNNICEGTSITFTASAINEGPVPVYQWKVNGVDSGTNSSTYSYTPNDGDIISCLLTSNAICAIGNPAISNTIEMIVNQTLPVSIGITANPSGPVCVGTPVTFTGAAINCGPTPAYQWKVNGVGAGTNNSTFNYIPSNGDIVSCVLISDATCTTGNPASSNPIEMIVNPLMPVSTIISADPPGFLCEGTQVTYTAVTFNGGSSPSYQWNVNGLNAGGNDITFDYTPLDGDVITCILTSNFTCATGNPAISNEITMTVNSILPVSIGITSNSSGVICEGTMVTFTGAAINGGLMPIYQWNVNGVNVGTNDPSYGYIPSNGDLIECTLTSNASCATGNPANSNVISVTVSPALPVSIGITAFANPVCEGTPVTFTGVAMNGGTNPVYQWNVNGVTVGTNSNSYSYTPSNGDLVTCTLISNATCATGSPAYSNVISMTVNPNLPVSIGIAASMNPVCEGTPVTFTAAVMNGGSTPVYQWSVNGVDVASNSNSYSYTPSNGDLVTCKLTSNATCPTGNPANSNVIIMTVNPNLPVSMVITASMNPVCEGTPVMFTAASMNGGSTPVYQWNVNGIDVGTNSASYSYIPSSGDLVSCKLTSNETCLTGNPANSNVINMTVDPNLPVSIGITASANPVCEGTPVTFTGAAVNGGSTPVYQWNVNGIDAGNNFNTFSYTPSNGDIVSCRLTSSATCPTGNPANSNVITMTVDPNLLASIGIAASANPVCEGIPVTFTGAAINGGSTPVYQWSVNGIDAGNNFNTFSYTPSNGDIVSCRLTSSATCATGSPANSNVITITVNPNLPVSIGITASVNPVCEGIPVTFTGAAINGGSTPVYQWKVNGADVGTNNDSYSYSPSNGDLVSCKLISNATCATGSPANSNIITMTVNPNLPVSMGITASMNPVCEGTPVTFTGAFINGGSTPVYQWNVNGVDVGNNSNSYSYSPSNGDLVICKLTSNATCATGSPSTSNVINMEVNPLMPVTVSITAPFNPTCEGTSLCYVATVINGGSSPVYRWQINGIDAGSNTAAFCYIPSNGDVISCRVTSNLVCATPNPANSNGITMIVNPLMPVSISIIASENPACEGNHVMLAGSAINGGSAPVYQWNVNGVDVGTSSNSYGYTPSNGDLVTCKLTSNETCATGSPANSNTITMIVNPNLPVSIGITASMNPVCEGTLVTHTGAALNGGSAPVYQWTVNGVDAGINNSSYSYIPSNGDLVTCKLTSNANCATGNPATSNTINMTVNPNLPVSISITADPSGIICEGTPVTYTGATINSGSTPVYQWQVNSNNVGSNLANYTYIPVNGDVVTCILTSDEICTSGNPATSNPVTMSVAVMPVVTFSQCIDPVTTTIAKPFKLKGGIPLGGTYSGPGVNPSTGMFSPSSAGAGIHQLTYTYNNSAFCTASAFLTIVTLTPSPVICGTDIIDPRDNQSYPTVLAGTQCWFAKNLNYGQQINSALTQRDNCQVEKYCSNDDNSRCLTDGGFYHWEEMMQYDEQIAAQGLCPPGWHIPGEDEWNILFNSFSGGAYAGDHLKSGGSSGFNALLVGGFFKNRSWAFHDLSGFFWSSTTQGELKAWAHGLNENNHGVSFYPSSRSNAYSVRCIND